MSIDLHTRSSPVVAGRCADCGRFISRHESHFHGPKRKFRGPPKAHIWADGGALVTRCDDVEQARQMLTRKYAAREFTRRWSELDADERLEIEQQFPISEAIVQRGRVVVQPPESEYSWVWMPLKDDARGPGVTTAVVWYW